MKHRPTARHFAVLENGHAEPIGAGSVTIEPTAVQVHHDDGYAPNDYPPPVPRLHPPTPANPHPTAHPAIRFVLAPSLAV